MRYAVLLRGINAGSKNRVAMEELRTLTEGLGFKNVSTYINSGNLFFDSDEDKEIIKKKISELFQENYPFVNVFALISKTEYDLEYKKLPKWWKENLARKDVLFYTDKVDKEILKESINKMSLKENEVVAFGDIAVFWGKYDEKEFLKTAYHKQLMKSKFYKEITIRNGNTFEKIGEFLKDK